MSLDLEEQCGVIPSTLFCPRGCTFSNDTEKMRQYCGTCKSKGIRSAMKYPCARCNQVQPYLARTRHWRTLCGSIADPSVPRAPPTRAVPPTETPTHLAPPRWGVRTNFHHNSSQTWQPVLVPIRLHLKLDPTRWLNEQFVIDLNDPSLCVEQAVRIVCEDLDLPISHEVALVQQALQQIEAFRRAQSRPRPEKEHRILIRLDLSLNGQTFKDQFEWDLAEPLNSAELFAERTVRECGLPRAFESAIAHAIREQAALFVPPLPALSSAFRTDNLAEWAPSFG